MDILSRVAAWLGENEATISAVVGIMVLTGIVVATPSTALSGRAGWCAAGLTSAILRRT